MIGRRGTSVLVVALFLAGGASGAAAQEQDTATAPQPYFSFTDSAEVADTTDRAGPGGAPAAGTAAADEDGFPIPVGFSGSAEFVGDGYAARGISARRPGAMWRLAVSSRFSLFGEINFNMNLLVSQEESTFQQDVGQLGLSPSWRWITVHLGDFTNDYSPLTLQGIRLRGGGIDLTPGKFRFSVQGGRVRRQTTTITGEGAFRRNLVALRVGYGAENASYLDLIAVGARDEFTRSEVTEVYTLLVDTIPEGLQPRVATRPQEGMTAGLQGQLVLLDGAVRLRGEGAMALTNGDRSSPEVSVDDAELAMPGVVASVFGGVVPVRYSSSFDLAYSADATIRMGTANLQGGYEFVGGGYNSLGLPYLVNDRQGYNLGGGLGLLDGRVNVQARYQHRANNVLSQQLASITRDGINTSITVRASDRLTTVLTGFITDVANDAPDSLRLDMRSWSAAANASLRQPLFGLETSFSLAYNVQQTTDGRAGAPVPAITTHNVQGSVDVPVAEQISVAPTVSGVLTRPEGQPSTTNVYLGFRGSGRFLEDGKLRTNASLSHTISQGRKILNGSARASYPTVWDTQLMLQLRHAEYSAFGGRPAFGETFVTLSLRRAF